MTQKNATQKIEVSTGATVHDVIQMIISGTVSGDVNVELRSQVEKLSDYLARTMPEFEAGIYRRIFPPPSSPAQPYKGLYFFDIEDAAIFFGRDAALEEFLQIVLKDRLSVLHARSGEGKTSFLRAGIAPKLILEGRLPVFVRTYDDPVRAIKQAIAPPR